MDYLDRLRGLGVGDAYIELERDAWIMLAAQDPLSAVDAVIAEKNRQLDEDPDMTRLYRLLGSAPEWPQDDPRVVELADLVEHLRIRAVQSGELEIAGADQTDPLTALLDAAMTESAPVARQPAGDPRATWVAWLESTGTNPRGTYPPRSLRPRRIDRQSATGWGITSVHSASPNSGHAEGMHGSASTEWGTPNRTNGRAIAFGHAESWMP